MKYFILVILFFLYACESTSLIKHEKKNIKNKGIQMNATINPSIKMKK